MDLQQDTLRKAGCSRVFTDTVSGATRDRAGLLQMLSFLRAGDTLVVWRLDRLGRSLKHLIETVSILHDRGIGFVSLTEHIDTTTSSGKLIFHMFAALAEFERDVIRERTQAGLQAARARGRLGGRPLLLAGAKKLAMVQAMYDDKSNTVEDICQALHISRATLYRYLKANRATTDTIAQSEPPERPLQRPT